jgi:L-lactate dehydrogenase
MGRPHRVAIVGVGHVGATTAYALLLSGLAPEIVLIDLDAQRAQGEAMDLMHAVPFSDPVHVWAGGYEDVEGAAVVVLAAGANQRPGETRLELPGRNAAILHEIVPQVIARAPDAILLMATNPVDVLTWATLSTSTLSARRVIGSGTILDTARFRSLLSRHFGVDPRSMHAHIIGEHGDTEVAAWSIATIGGMPIAGFQNASGRVLDRESRERIVTDTRRAAYEIIERKGALTVSSRLTGSYGLEDVCLSLPCIVNRSGIAQLLDPPLAAEELSALRHSADALKAAQRSLV